MFNWGRKHESAAGRQRLDQAIAACRQSISTPQRLSAETRGAILQAALDHTAHPGRFPSLFIPVRRIFAAGMAPVVVIAVGLMMNLGPVGDGDWSAIKGVHAKKLGDQVVFTLEDGNGPHRVYRSTTPGGFDRARGIRVEHSRFVDLASSGPEIVYYWIE